MKLSIALLCLIAWAAAQSVVQSNSATGSAVTSLPVTLTGVVNGNTIVVGYRVSGNTATVTPTDNKSNTYTQVVNQDNMAVGGHNQRLFYAKNVVGGTVTITGAFAVSNSSPWVVAYELGGTLATSPFGGSSSTYGTSTTPSCGTVTNSVPKVLVLGVTTKPSGTSATITAGSGFTLDRSDPARGGAESKVVTTIAAQSANFTIATSSAWTCSVSVWKAPPAITTTTLSGGTVGTAYSQTLAATNGVTPFTWSLDSGTLPAGLSLSSSGIISGTPTAAATSNFTVKATDSASGTDTQALSITTVPAGIHRYVSKTGNNANNGLTTGTSWLTLAYAFSQASSGMTIHVGDGTYTENNLAISASGTSTSRIRVIADNQGGALIRTSSSYHAIRTTGNYIDLMGFDISGDAATCIGIRFDGNNSRAIGNWVHDIQADYDTCGTSGGMGIGSATQSTATFNNDAIGNKVWNIGHVYYVSNARKLDPRVHGIYWMNKGGLIANNDIHDVAGFAIHFLHYATDQTVVHNTTAKCGYGGMYVATTDGLGFSYSNILAANNIFLNNTNTGHFQTGAAFATYGIIETHSIGTSRRYKNNLVRGNGTNLSLAAGATNSGNITTDNGFPTFVDYADNDYHVASTSSQIYNAGTTDNASMDTDLEGGTRPQNTSFDIGAYEFNAIAATWPWF